MSRVLILSSASAAKVQRAIQYVVWAVKHSVKGLWHQIGRPCLLLVSEALWPTGEKKWAVMIHHWLFVRYNIEKQPSIMHSSSIMTAVFVTAYSVCNLKRTWKHKWKRKTWLLFRRLPGFSSQLLPAEYNVDFTNSLFSVEEILHLDFTAWTQLLQ